VLLIKYVQPVNERQAGERPQGPRTVVTALDAQSKKGDKALGRQLGPRRYLRKTRDTGPPSRLILASIPRMRVSTASQCQNHAVAGRSCDTATYSQVESFVANEGGCTRRIFRSTDAAIRGHVFCSLLALTMQNCLQDLSREAGIVPARKSRHYTQGAPAVPLAIGISDLDLQPNTSPDRDAGTNRKVDPSKVNASQAKKGNMG
jgi:hypothetical protein